MKTGFLDKLISRLDLVTPEEVLSLVTRLAKEKGFLENVFEALSEGMMILDPKGLLTFSNQAAINIFGFSKHSYTGESIDKLVRGLDWESLAHPDKVVSRDMEIFYPERRYLNFYISPITEEITEEAGHIGYVMLVRDETKRRQTVADEVESEKLNALTMLAAGVAHEIGNPLNSMDIHLQLLARKIKKLPEEYQKPLLEHLETSQSETRRLDEILKSFLQAIRPTNPKREKAKLHTILEATLKGLSSELLERNTQVSLDLTSNEPILSLDKSQIHQALYNLIRNAAQALPASGGKINISSIANAYELQLSINDNGEGISSEKMSALFEPFQSTKQSGSGLGLLIVRRIIREHGGELEIESEQGKGTTVTLFLPRQEKLMRMIAPTAEKIIDIENSK